MSLQVDRVVRKFIPSIAKLSYHPVAKVLLDGPDLIANLLVSGYRDLPPNHLRVRIGVGNQIFGNQPWYFTGARDFWYFAWSRGWITLDSTIVDIGCGCGKFAHHFRDYEYNGSKFLGKYIGIDIDAEMLNWCSRHFDSERFTFHLSSHVSKVYNPAGAGSPYTLPLEPNSVDLVFSSSLFTHLLEPEILNYMSESLRVLRPDAVMVMNCFLMDYPSYTFGGRHTFRFRIGNAFVESIKLPEAAVAYESASLIDFAKSIGFRSHELVVAPGSGKPLLVCRK